jgi:hypothetical protein
MLVKNKSDSARRKKLQKDKRGSVKNVKKRQEETEKSGKRRKEKIATEEIVKQR